MADSSDLEADHKKRIVEYNVKVIFTKKKYIFYDKKKNKLKCIFNITP